MDVDDTLVRTVGSKRIPMPNTIRRVRELFTEGHTMYLWSSGGADYCRASAEELGISDCFVGFLPKPELFIDDQEFQDWRNLRHERP